MQNLNFKIEENVGEYAYDILEGKVLWSWNKILYITDKR